MSKQVEILIYRITGQQLFFDVPHAWCEECDLTINLTKTILTELGVHKGDQRVKLIVKPWINNMVAALGKGGWHAPVLMIDGQIFSQGIVPDKTKLKDYLSQKLAVSQL